MSIEFSYLDPAKIYTGRKLFDCEHAVINKFVRDSLVSQVKGNLSVAYVLTDSEKNDRFVGFFTIAHHSIDSSLLSQLQLGSITKVHPLRTFDHAWRGQSLQGCSTWAQTDEASPCDHETIIGTNGLLWPLSGCRPKCCEFLSKAWILVA